MVIRYTDEAEADLLAIIDYGIDHDLPDPVAYTRTLRSHMKHLEDIKHPGRKGRVVDTTEWVVSGTPYLAVFIRDNGATTILRVLHGAQQWP